MLKTKIDLLGPTEDLCRYWPPARVVSHEDGGDEDAEAEAGDEGGRDEAERGGGRGQVNGAHPLLDCDLANDPGQREASVHEGREEASEDDEHSVLKQRENDLVHELV